MSTIEMRTALKEMHNFIANEERQPVKRCRNFFEVIHQIRVAMQIITELLSRIEKLEDEINNLKIK